MSFINNMIRRAPLAIERDAEIEAVKYKEAMAASRGDFKKSLREIRDKDDIIDAMHYVIR